MASELLLTDAAVTDLREAYDWYEQQREGLGGEFRRCVEARLEGIVGMPTVHEKVYRNFHRALVRRFPYAVYYEQRDGTVVVHAVLHTARDASKWRKRLL